MASRKGVYAAVFRCSLIASFFIPLIGGELRGGHAWASEEGRVAKLIEGAKTEGKMVWYSNFILPDASRIIKRFEEKYPFLKVDLFRADSVILLNKIVNEARARKYIPDAVQMPGFQTTLLTRGRLYAGYVSPESHAYPEGFKDREGNWNSTEIVPYVMAYNTQMLSRKDIPDTFEGFLQPRWKNKKIGFDTKEVEWFANILKIMGEEKGLDFLRKFAAQDLNYRRDRALMRDLIIAGEFPVGTAYVHQIEDRKKMGAKVDWWGPAPVIAKLNTIGLAAHTPHPNAGKLFIDFILSAECQAMIAGFGRVPARPGTDADILRKFKDIKVHPSDIAMADKLNAYRKLSDEIFIVGGR